MMNCRPLYYDIEGNPVDRDTWGLMFERTNRTLGHDIIGQYRVSTVYVGLDMNIFSGSKPLIFETMIFGPDESELHMWQDRYCDREAALRGHEYACRLARGEITEAMVECL